jgi:hypothetical protein
LSRSKRSIDRYHSVKHDQKEEDEKRTTGFKIARAATNMKKDPIATILDA